MFLRWLFRKLEFRRVIYEKLNMSYFTYLTQEFVDKIRDEIQLFGLKVQTTQGLVCFCLIFCFCFVLFCFCYKYTNFYYKCYWRPTIMNCTTPLHVQHTVLCTSLEFQPSDHVMPFPAKLKIIVLSKKFYFYQYLEL